jgi:hypothetical protein
MTASEAEAAFVRLAPEAHDLCDFLRKLSRGRIEPMYYYFPPADLLSGRKPGLGLMQEEHYHAEMWLEKVADPLRAKPQAKRIAIVVSRHVRFPNRVNISLTTYPLEDKIEYKQPYSPDLVKAAADRFVMHAVNAGLITRADAENNLYPSALPQPSPSG